MMKTALFNLLLVSLLKLSTQGDTNSHLFPPGALGSDQMSEFNVTGSLNSFVEQLQANSQSQEIPVQQVPVVQMPSAPQGHGSVIYYGNQQTPLQPQQPVVIGPQNRPALDPALQQLLNSFNTNPQDQRSTFISNQPELNAPVVSYITCYVGCSHVTNIVTNSAQIVNSFNLLSSTLLMVSVIFALLF